MVEVHDLHVWALSTTENALTAHLVHEDGHVDALLPSACGIARSRFGVGHATFQVETPEGARKCRLRCVEVL